MPFLEGYITGLALIVLIGPVLFILLRITLEFGKASGFAVALGIFVSDIIAVLLCSFGAASFFTNPSNQLWIALGGALLLSGFGLRYIIKPDLSKADDLQLKNTQLVGSFIKGFLVNFINPFVFMIWIGIIGTATNRHGFDGDLLWFMTGCVLGVFTLDSLKVLFADKLESLLTSGTLKIVYRVFGILLLLFSLRLLMVGISA